MAPINQQMANFQSLFYPAFYCISCIRQTLPFYTLSVVFWAIILSYFSYLSVGSSQVTLLVLWHLPSPQLHHILGLVSPTFFSCSTFIPLEILFNLMVINIFCKMNPNIYLKLRLLPCTPSLSRPKGHSPIPPTIFSILL